MQSRIGTPANKRPRTGGYDGQFARQIGYLRNSCSAFDVGDHEEAPRLATALRVLLHDRPESRSTSLLTHMGIKDELWFLDTAIYRHLYDIEAEAWAKEQGGENAVFAGKSPSQVGLVEMGFASDGTAGWYAPLRSQRTVPSMIAFKAMRRPQPFAAWWNDPAVESSTGKLFSRSHLVTIMANQDGGAHVDAALDADYDDLCIDFLGLQSGWSDAPFDLETSLEIPSVANNVAFASVRQIAFEVMTTLERHYAYRDKPGLYALAQPYAHLEEPDLPHTPSRSPMPIVLAQRVQPAGSEKAG